MHTYEARGIVSTRSFIYMYTHIHIQTMKHVYTHLDMCV